MDFRKSFKGLQAHSGDNGSGHSNITRAQFLSITAGLSTFMAGCTNRTKTGDVETSLTDMSQATPVDGVLRFFFCAGVTREYGNGDCVLVEYEGPDGGQLFGLIDAGRKIETQDGTSTIVLDYLASHGVNTLEFLVLTHHHNDHYGDAAIVLQTLNVRTLYIKHYDRQFSGRNIPEREQRYHEAILKAALSAHTRVVGIDPRLLDVNFEQLAYASPSMSDRFLSWLIKHPKAQKLCEAFDEKNTSFVFGKANMQLINWESWDESGGPWDVSGALPHEIVSGENCNSMGLVVRFGKTSALIAGDMNNFASGGWSSLGDETRLAAEIGHVDFFKLNHHGTSGSNSVPFLNALRPCHVQITNDMYGCIGETLSWLNDHGVDYAYTTSDPVGTVVTFDGDTVFMDYEMHERFIRDGTEVHFLSATADKSALPVVYHETVTSASTWEQLAALILENASSWELNSADGCVEVESLRIDVAALNGGVATSCIIISPGQKVTLITETMTTISRSSILTEESLFYVEGELLLEGPLVLDGNCGELGSCRASLIENFGGSLTISGAALINNTKLNLADLNDRNGKTCSGGAIVSFAGITKLCSGATIKGNSCILERNYSSRPEASEWACKGGGVAVFAGCLDVDGATIEDNECIIRVSLNADYDTSKSFAAELYARGGGVYHEDGINSSWRNLILRNNSAHNESLFDDITKSVEPTIVVQGGGCWAHRSCIAILDSTIDNNSLFGEASDTLQGAGAYVARSQVDVCGSRFEGNTGAAGGGGVAAYVSRVSLLDCIFSNNIAKQNGGGMAASGRGDSCLSIVGCKFSDNHAESANGGALWSSRPTRIENSVFEGNSAYGRGGAVLANGGIHADAKCFFSGNSAKVGSDLSAGGKAMSYVRLEVAADIELGKFVTPNPIDSGPKLSAVAYPCCSYTDRNVIEIEVASRTGLADLTVNGETCHWNRYVANGNGTYKVAATDLAGHSTSQLLTLGVEL